MRQRASDWSADVSTDNLRLEAGPPLTPLTAKSRDGPRRHGPRRHGQQPTPAGTRSTAERYRRQPRSASKSCRRVCSPNHVLQHVIVIELALIAYRPSFPIAQPVHSDQGHQLT